MKVDATLASSMTRRAWLSSSATMGLGAALLASSLPAQEPRLQGTLRSMSAMTGTELPEAWVQPTTALLGVILDDSKALRALDLGEIEPATIFVAV